MPITPIRILSRLDFTYHSKDGAYATGHALDDPWASQMHLDNYFRTFDMRANRNGRTLPKCRAERLSCEVLKTAIKPSKADERLSALVLARLTSKIFFSDQV